MAHIVIDAEQAKVITESTGRIEVRDPSGRCLGYVMQGTAANNHGWTAEDIAEAKAAIASDEPRYTTAQVLENLRSLEND